MAHDISKSYVIKFDDMVKQAYQENGGNIRGYIQNRTGVIGNKHTFNVYGKGTAKAAPVNGADVETMSTTTSVVEAILEESQASEYSNIFENDKVNFDDESELVKVIASALGRKEDEILIKALRAASALSDNSVGQIPAANKIVADFETTGTKTGLTVAKIEEALVALDDAGVPEEGRILIAPTRSKRELISSVQVGSIDYNDVKPLVNGQVDTFLGFKFIWIGNDTLGLGDGTDDYCYALHRDSLCLAVGNLDKQTRIDYVPQKMSYLVASPLRAGAVVREGAGVVEIKIKTVGAKAQAAAARTVKK